MKSVKVISYKQIPVRIPTVPTIVAWLLLDRLQAAGWVWGVVGTMFALIWISSVTTFFMQETVDVIKD